MPMLCISVAICPATLLSPAFYCMALPTIRARSSTLNSANVAIADVIPIFLQGLTARQAFPLELLFGRLQGGLSIRSK